MANFEGIGIFNVDDFRCVCGAYDQAIVHGSLSSYCLNSRLLFKVFYELLFFHIYQLASATTKEELYFTDTYVLF